MPIPNTIRAKIKTVRITHLGSLLTANFKSSNDWGLAEGLHIPLIIRWPKNFPAPAQIKPGLVDDRFIEAIDFVPTMLDIAGLKKPEKMQGRIFLGANAEAPRTS